MNKKTQKLERLVEKYLNKPKQEIHHYFGEPQRNSDHEVSFYNHYKYGIFRNEIAFVFSEDKVVDIVITEYFLWIELYAIYYFEGQTPTYKVVKFGE